jgi:hypothetical protein
LDESQLAARLKEFDPRLERIYRDAKNITIETADALDENFQLSARIMRVFRSYLAREARSGQKAKKNTGSHVGATSS